MPKLRALITGASRGLGLALCQQLAERGWHVAALSRHCSPELALLQVQNPQHICWFACDVTETTADIAVQQALVYLGGLQLLINNAGLPGHSQGLATYSDVEMQTLFNTHTMGCLRICRACLDALLCSQAPHIVNISSRLGSISATAQGQFLKAGFSYSYRVAKAGLNMLSACMTEEFGPKGLRVSVLHPGQFLSATAASDAVDSAENAAAKILAWLATRDQTPLVYVEPRVRELMW